MKRHAVAPPTPKRQERSPTGPVKLDDTKGERDLDFMEATFRVVGYQRHSSENTSKKDKKEKKDENGKDSVFQPNRRKSLSKGKVDLVKFIQEHFEIPKDFETNSKYGPYSGLCFEDRLITSYEWRQLEPKDNFKRALNADDKWKMCWRCLELENHLAREGCPNVEDT